MYSNPFRPLSFCKPALAVCVAEFAGSTILPSSVVAPNDVARLKQQIKIASKRNRSRRFFTIMWKHSTDVRHQEHRDRKGTKKRDNRMTGKARKGRKVRAALTFSVQRTTWKQVTELLLAESRSLFRLEAKSLAS